MACVDWQSILRPASFRGVPFFVEKNEVEFGRRLVVHEFPKRDAPFVEDMGAKAVKYPTTAYVASDNVLAEAAALQAACNQRGPGTLVLPDIGAVQVCAHNCKRDHSLDKLGLVGFTLEFVDAGVDLSALPVALTELLVGVSATAAIAAITSNFMGLFSIANEASWVVGNAVDGVQGWGAALDSVVGATTMTADGGTATAALVAGIVRDAPALVRDTVTPVAFARTSFAAPATGNVGGALVARMADAIGALRTGAVDDATATAALYQLSSFGLPDPVPAGGLSSQQDAVNTAAINQVARCLALVGLATAAAEADWTDRPTAVQWRANVSELFEGELVNAGAGTDLYAALSAVRGKAATAISRKMATLQPVITVTASAPAPSIVWAYRLYADATKAGDLIDRNRIRYPASMPTTFEALASQS